MQSQKPGFTSGGTSSPDEERQAQDTSDRHQGYYETQRSS